MPKATPLTKAEVRLLVRLIAQNRIILSKTTSHATNKLKDLAWTKITEELNSSDVSICRRTPEQLRLKWENLKKASRKRKVIQSQCQNSEVQPDEALDEVASMLDDTSNGIIKVAPIAEEKTQTQELLKTQKDINTNKVEVPRPIYNSILAARQRTVTKRKRKTEDVAASAVARNKAAEEFFKKKTQILDLDVEERRLKVEQLELQNKKLMLEIDRLNNLQVVKVRLPKPYNRVNSAPLVE